MFKGCKTNRQRANTLLVLKLKLEAQGSKMAFKVQVLSRYSLMWGRIWGVPQIVFLNHGFVEFLRHIHSSTLCVIYLFTFLLVWGSFSSQSVIICFHHVRITYIDISFLGFQNEFWHVIYMHVDKTTSKLLNCYVLFSSLRIILVVFIIF